MTDPLYDLLLPHISPPSSSSPLHPQSSPLTSDYLRHLTTLSLDELSTTEPSILSQSNHSSLISLQSLCSRSYKSIINSADELKALSEKIPTLKTSTCLLQDAIPGLDEEAVKFSTFYSRTNTENAVLDRRKKAMLLSRSVDRLADILELPSLLSTTIASAASSTGAGAGLGTTNYSSALDLFAHIKRLHTLYPESPIVKSVLLEAESAMKDMTSNLVASLRTQQNIRLAAAIRTIGWLRRVTPELGGTVSAVSGVSPDVSLDSKLSSLHLNSTSSVSNDEGYFGALFLVCRLANLLSMLEALSPLRDLADQETERRYEEERSSKLRNRSGAKAIVQPQRRPSSLHSHGQQTERYLKRYIEIFREQSFATISMYRNVFPKTSTADEGDASQPTSAEPLLTLPTALATFPMHLVDLLMETLRTYMPNVQDPTARESLLMQVLYTAGSLGRLGADFSMFIAMLNEADEDDEEHEDDNDESDHPVEQDGADDSADSKRPNGTNADGAPEEDLPIPEWATVIKKHRIQAERLEALAKSGSNVEKG
ncbi:MAG: hypothetical protein Q9160_006258 [Pyrenula sp. 1 TL-2023]